MEDEEAVSRWRHLQLDFSEIIASQLTRNGRTWSFSMQIRSAAAYMYFRTRSVCPEDGRPRGQTSED